MCQQSKRNICIQISNKNKAKTTGTHPTRTDQNRFQTSSREREQAGQNKCNRQPANRAKSSNSCFSWLLGHFILARRLTTKRARITTGNKHNKRTRLVAVGEDFLLTQCVNSFLHQEKLSSLGLNMGQIYSHKLRALKRNESTRDMCSLIFRKFVKQSAKRFQDAYIIYVANCTGRLILTFVNQLVVYAKQKLFLGDLWHF